MSTTEPEESGNERGDEQSGSDQVEEEYALGRTSDPDGAEREEPAGEDYAGSGF